jgi:hypothetical protein
MSFLKPMGKGPGYLKAGFLGFASAGKTYTAVELALGTRALMKQTGPIAMFDTEGGSDYIAKRIREETGQDLVGVKSRSLDDLIGVAREAETMASVLIVDSVTHIWREVCDAYLEKKNRKLLESRRPKQFGLQFEDWGPIKGAWAKWTDLFLNARLHIIICGRAGYEYDQVENDRGKKELVKTGTKMKVENEFGFEPSLLIEMDRAEERGQQVNRATILKDRFDLINGKSCDNPRFEFFKPHVSSLVPGAHTEIDVSVKTDVDVDEQGRDPWAREKRQREILCEEIQGEMIRRWPTQSAGDKKDKAEAIERVFSTRSWTKVEGLHSDVLTKGLARLRAESATPGVVDPAVKAEEDEALNVFGAAAAAVVARDRMAKAAAEKATREVGEEG